MSGENSVTVSRGSSQLTSTTNGVGVGMNVARQFVAPARLYMVGKNQGKAAVINHPTPRKINSGDEQEYARTARKIEITVPSEVEAIFYVKDPMSDGKELFWGTHYVIMRSLEDGTYYLLTMPKFFTQNTELGFEFHYDKKLMKRLVKGEWFKAGTVFGTSARITDQGEWVPGIEARVAPMSDCDCEEDAIKISESFAKKVGVVFERSFEKSWFENEWILLNLYGTEDNHQGFPLCGECVREDGILFGLRRKDSNNALVTLTKKGLMKPDGAYDKLFYAPPGAVVTDIKVETERYKNQANNRKAGKPTTPHTELLERYERNFNTFYNNVISWYTRKKSEHRNSLVPCSPELFNFILQARGQITVDTSIKRDNSYNMVKRKFKYIPQKDWRLIIKVKEEVSAKVRHKMTGVHGNKATIGKVVPDARMPIDDYGNRAEIVVSNFPDFRRQIFGSLIELDVNFANIHIHPDVKRAVEDGNYSRAWDIVTKFYETVSPAFSEVVQLLTADERIEHVQKIAKDENEFSLELDSDVSGIDMIKSVAKQYEHIKPTPVTYINARGKTIRTLNPVPITSAYYMMLDKHGDDISSQSTPRFNIFGVPTSFDKEDKARNFYRAKLNRNVGVVEGRLMINQYGGAFTVAQVTLGNSPEAINNAVRRIMRSDNPFNIPRMVYPGEEINNFSLGYIKSVLSDTGIILRKECEDDKR